MLIHGLLDDRMNIKGFIHGLLVLITRSTNRAADENSSAQVLALIIQLCLNLLANVAPLYFNGHHLLVEFREFPVIDSRGLWDDPSEISG